MNEKGYVYLKGVLSDDAVNYALSAYDGKLVDYPKMRDFIDTRFLPAVTRKLTFMTQPHYVKFRFSDNNNSTDAAVVHRDVYNFTSEKTIPMFTILCYFDESEMELHESSHGPFETNVVKCYGSRKRIKMKKGDVLVFHSTLLHRGVKFGRTTHRRLLQVFEVFPTAGAYRDYFPLFCIVRMQKTTTFDGIKMEMAKHSTLVDAYNAFHFFIVYYDLQYKIFLSDVSPLEKSGRTLSYEAAASMDYKDASKNPTNINIICDTKVCRLKPGRFYLYLLVTLVVVGVGLQQSLKRSKKNKK
jgi:hypothetical protein